MRRQIPLHVLTLCVFAHVAGCADRDNSTPPPSVACTASSDVTPLATSPNSLDDAVVAAAGTEFGVFWRDSRDSNNPTTKTELYFMAVDVDGASLTEPVRITTSTESVWTPVAVWDGKQYVVVFVRGNALHRVVVDSRGSIVSGPHILAVGRDPQLAVFEGVTGLAYKSEAAASCSPCSYSRQQLWFSPLATDGVFAEPAVPVDDYQWAVQPGPDSQYVKSFHLTQSDSGFSLLWVRQQDDKPSHLRRVDIDRLGKVTPHIDYALAEPFNVRHAVASGEVVVAWSPLSDEDLTLFKPSAAISSSLGGGRPLLVELDGANATVLKLQPFPPRVQLLVVDKAGTIQSQVDGPELPLGVHYRVASGSTAYGVAFVGRPMPIGKQPGGPTAVWFTSFKCQ